MRRFCCNKQAATQQLEYLQKQTADNLDTQWGVVFAFKTIDGKTQELVKFLNETFNPILEDEDLRMKTHLQGTTLWISFYKPVEIEQIKDAFNMIFAGGFEEFAEKNENSIQMLLSSNTDFTLASELLKKGDRFMSVIMKSLKFIMKFDLSQDLAQTIQNVLENFEPDLAKDPQMNLFLKFKNFKVDLEYKSSDDCPEFIRKNGFYGKKISQWIQNGEAVVQDEQAVLIIKQIQEVIIIVQSNKKQSVIQDLVKILLQKNIFKIIIYINAIVSFIIKIKELKQFYLENIITQLLKICIQRIKIKLTHKKSSFLIIKLSHQIVQFWITIKNCYNKKLKKKIIAKIRNKFVQSQTLLIIAIKF